MRELKRRPFQLIPLADKEKVEKFTQMSQHTLRNWRTQKIHPELFLSIGRKVFLDKQAWTRFVRKSKLKSIQEAKSMEELLG